MNSLIVVRDVQKQEVLYKSKLICIIHQMRQIIFFKRNVINQSIIVSSTRVPCTIGSKQKHALFLLDQQTYDNIPSLSLTVYGIVCQCSY